MNSVTNRFAPILTALAASFVMVLAGLSDFLNYLTLPLSLWGWHVLNGPFGYSGVVLSINYFNAGFVRRGLGGTIAALLATGYLEKGLLFQAMSLVWVITPIAILIVRLAKRAGIRSAVYMAAIVSLSPQTFLGWSRDIGRTDLLAVGFIAWAVFATINNRRWIGVIALLVGYLAHETAIVFGAPILFVMNASAIRIGEIPVSRGVLLALLAFCGVSAFTFANYEFSAKPPVIEKIMSAAPNAGKVKFVASGRDIAEYMEVSGIRGIRTAICRNLTEKTQYFVMAGFTLLYLALYFFVLPDLQRKVWAVAGAVFLPTIFMLIIGNDIGRWLKFGVISEWLLAAWILIANGDQNLSQRSMMIGASLLVLLLALGPSSDVASVSFRLAHFFDTHGFPLPKAPTDWISSCDPDWKRVLQR